MKYKTYNFGRYFQDAEGKVLTDLTWKVLKSKSGKTLLITEKVIDHRQFNSVLHVFWEGSLERHILNNKWEESDIRKWLNSEFMDIVFTPKEKEQIIEVTPDDKLFLLSEDEYNEYFPKQKDGRAEYSDFALRKMQIHHNTNSKNYGAFWWLRTANTEDTSIHNSSECVLHVCSDGYINRYEEPIWNDGVRPAVWIKTQI